MERIVLGCFFILILISSLYYEHYDYNTNKDPMIDYLKSIIAPIHPIIPQIEFYTSDKSYTLNKEKIYLCLTDNNGNYYSLNMLIYVALHEVAHVLCVSHGHTSEFYEIFDDLMLKAKQLDVYNQKIPHVDNYRGSSES